MCKAHGVSHSKQSECVTSEFSHLSLTATEPCHLVGLLLLHHPPPATPSIRRRRRRLSIDDLVLLVVVFCG